MARVRKDGSGDGGARAEVLTRRAFVNSDLSCVKIDGDKAVARYTKTAYKYKSRLTYKREQ